MKKNKWYLRIFAAVLAFGIIAVLLSFVISFTGNPISKYIHEKKIYEYALMRKSNSSKHCYI